MWALLLFAGVLANAQIFGGLSYQTFGTDTTTFSTITANMSGFVSTNSFVPLTQIMSLGRGLFMAHGYTLNGVNISTTVTFAVAIRDATIMPDVTLEQAYATVLAQTCIGNVTSVIDPAVVSGGTTTTATGTWFVGSVDSYGNTFAMGDSPVIDWIVVVTANATEQPMTINLYAFSDTGIIAK